MSTFELAGRQYQLIVPIVGASAGADRGIAGVLPCAETRKGDDQIIYSRTEDAADLSFANSGRAPILDSHYRSISCLLGAITRAWWDDGSIYFTGRLAPVAEADRIWAFLSGGFSVSTSLGAEIVSAELTGPSPWGGKRYQVHRWRLTEVSFVLHGGDPDAHAVRIGTEEADEILATRRPAAADEIRARLRLDRWSRWAVPTGLRLAEQLGTDGDRTATAMQVEVERHCSQLVEEQIA